MSTDASAPKREPVDMQRLRELQAKASPLPWEYYRAEDCIIKPHVQQVKPNGGKYTIAVPVHSNELTERNMQYVAAACTALPACLDEIEDLRAALKEARCWLPLNSTPQARGAICETLGEALAQIDAALAEPKEGM